MAFDISELTSGCPQDTSGVFEQLLSSVMKHVQSEYDNQRIRGSEYSQVYLNALQTTMQQAIQWHLGIETTKAQVALIEKQTEGQDKQNLLLDQQLLLLQAQTALTTEQVLTQEQQTTLVGNQGTLTTQQEANLTAEGLNIPKQGLILDAQEDATIAGKLNTEEQTKLIAEQIINAAYQNTDLLPVQKSKAESEVAILDQKFVTEEAQTKSTTSQGALTGILGAQRDLYEKQKDGFDRDAEQKATRIVTDIWGVLASTTDGVEAPGSADKTSLDATLVALKNNAGIV